MFAQKLGLDGIEIERVHIEWNVIIETVILIELEQLSRNYYDLRTPAWTPAHLLPVTFLQCNDFFHVLVKRIEAEIRNILKNYEDIFNQNMSTALRNMCTECKSN